MELDQTSLLEYFDNIIPKGSFEYGELGYVISLRDGELKFNIHALIDAIDIQVNRNGRFSSFCLKGVNDIKTENNILSVICNNGRLKIRRESEDIAFTITME